MAGEEPARVRRARARGRELLPAHEEAAFPGKQIAELFGIAEGPLHEQIDRNILHIGGDDHRRLRNLVNPAFTPRAADRWRPVMRGFIEELTREPGAHGLRRVRLPSRTRR